MICSWFNLGFLYVVSRAMGCFFGCFRVRDNNDRSRARPCLFSDPRPCNPTDTVVSVNNLSSLFQSDENEQFSREGKDTKILESPQSSTDYKGLKAEARYLKACGTLLQTPAEIRNASKKLGDSPPHDRDSGSSRFHSWLPNTSAKELFFDEQPGHLPTPAKSCEKKTFSSQSEDTHSSCVSDGRDMGAITTGSSECHGLKSNLTFQVHANQMDEISTASPSSAVTNLKYRNKVHFECDSSTPFLSSSSGSSEIVSHSSRTTRPTENHSPSKPSPYPTPLKLSDEMQTPGTVFPANLESVANGKNARIRSQFVHSVLNPVENFSQWKVLKEQDPLCEESEFPDSSDKGVSKTTEARESENSEPKELSVDASLSAWLKPKPSNQDDNHKQLVAMSSRKPHLCRTPGDRPIIGTVATHWNEEEFSTVSPKWWDGNGIPNSTNKYKEDQKVSWHATPFEERLEKALSEEGIVSQRRNSATPLVSDEGEDDAISHMKSSAHPAPVVSF